MTETAKPAPAVPDPTPQAAPVAGSLQGANPPGTITPSATGASPATPPKPGPAPDPHEPSKFLEKEAELEETSFTKNKDGNWVDSKGVLVNPQAVDANGKLIGAVPVEKPVYVMDPNDPTKMLVEDPKSKEHLVDVVTGIRTHRKTGKRTRKVATALKPGTKSIVAREYVGTGPLTVNTPGGDVKAYSGDFILTFDEPQFEIKDAVRVPVWDAITKRQKMKQTNLVISKEQMAVLGWVIDYEEVEVLADRPL